MTAPILLIDNLSATSPNSPAEIARNFGCESWLVGSSQGDRYKPRQAHGVECPSLGVWGDLVDFLTELSRSRPMILRVSAPHYPLHPALLTEVTQAAPTDHFDYALSTGEECGLAGYFLERITPAALARLQSIPIKVTPSGYLNLSGRPGSFRHWFSLDLRRFYYVNHFETLFDSPRNAAINLIGQCNYTCLKCQYHSSALPSKHTYSDEMSMDRLTAILEKFKDYKRLTSVYPTITGEPLLHSRIVDIVRMIKEAGYGCAFTSNASLLHPEISERLLDAGLDGIAFSVDTLDPVKYGRLQSGGSLDVVERNIIAYRDAYLRHRGTFAATINFVVGPDNEDEREAFRRHWSDLGLTVQFSTYYDIFDENRPYLDQLDWGPSQRMPCWALWMGLYLTAQGRLVSCGSMAKTLGIKDSLFDMSAAELWRCEAMETLRRQQLTGVRPGYCKQFNCWTGMLNTSTVDAEGVNIHSRSYSSHRRLSEMT